MKRLTAAALVTLGLLAPGVAFAGSSTDAALGLGAFAVFNQILGGVGIFGPGRPVVVAPQPVVYAPPPPPVVYQPAPVYYAPPPPVVYRPAPVYYAPPRVYAVPRPVYVAPAPVVVYRHPPAYRHVGWGHRKHH